MYLGMDGEIGKKLGKGKSMNNELIINICVERKKFQTTQPTHLMVNGEWRMYLWDWMKKSGKK